MHMMKIVLMVNCFIGEVQQVVKKRCTVGFCRHLSKDSYEADAIVLFQQSDQHC
jgi:hypothetical protein